MAVADLLFRVRYSFLESRDNALERKHIELSDTRVVALDCREEIQCRSVLEFFGNLLGRKVFFGRLTPLVMLLSTTKENNNLRRQ